MLKTVLVVQGQGAAPEHPIPLDTNLVNKLCRTCQRGTEKNPSWWLIILLDACASVLHSGGALGTSTLIMHDYLAHTCTKPWSILPDSGKS